MNINLLPNFNLFNQSNATYSNNASPSFGSRATDKLLNKIALCKNPKELKLTFDDLRRIYEDRGYDVVMKRGSHAVVNVNGTNIPLVIPHKDKYVQPLDIKRLKLVLLGKEKEAQKI